MKGATENILSKQFWFGFWRHLTENTLHSLLHIAGILLAYMVISYIVNHVVDSILARLMKRETQLGLSAERAGRLKTVQGLLRSIVGYVLFFVFGVMFLKAVGLDIMPFITTAGVIGLAVGFGSQKLIRDIISGFFIIIDGMFVVGDMVTIGAVTGRVEEMGMRVTKLQDVNGKVYLISNGDIGTITNLSRNPVEDFVEVNLAATADVGRAEALINTAGDRLFELEGHGLKAPPRLLGITAFSAASVTLRVSVVTEPALLNTEQMRVRAALRDAFATESIALA